MPHYSTMLDLYHMVNYHCKVQFRKIVSRNDKILCWVVVSCHRSPCRRKSWRIKFPDKERISYCQPPDTVIFRQASQMRGVVGIWRGLHVEGITEDKESRMHHIYRRRLGLAAYSKLKIRSSLVRISLGKPSPTNPPTPTLGLKVFSTPI